jgi:hypothetical protein
MTNESREGILKKHLEDGAASVVQVVIALIVGEVSLLLWVLPEYGKNLGFGPAPKSVSILGLGLPISLLPIIFVLIMLMLIALLKALSTLTETIRSGSFDTERLRLMLGRRPTALNPFLIPVSRVEWFACVVQFAFTAFFLLMPSLLGIGGYLKAPGRGSALGILGSSFLFLLPGAFAIVQLIAIMKQVGGSAFWILTCRTMAVVAAVIGVFVFYLVT